MSRKKPQMGVQPPRQPRWGTPAWQRKTDTIKFGRPMEEIMAALTEPYKTIMIIDGVEYSVPTESFRRGVYERPARRP